MVTVAHDDDDMPRQPRDGAGFLIYLCPAPDYRGGRFSLIKQSTVTAENNP
jgi:hypothetical protein